MMKRLLLSGAALTAMVSFAAAQTPPAEPSPPPAATEQPASPGASPSGMAAEQNTEDPNLFSNIKGADVIGQNNESVGSVADILFDSGGQVKALVIGHGGLVGIGQTYRNHEVSELPQVSDGKLTLGQMNTAAIEGLPEYKYPEAETGRAATDAAPSGSSSDPAMAPPPPAADQSAAAPASGSQLWPASYLVGANIQNGDQTAEINDLRFEGNKVAAVQIDKGALGLGTDVSEVPFEDLSISGTPAEPKIALKAETSPNMATQPSGGGSAAPQKTPEPPPASTPAPTTPGVPPQ